MPKDETNCCCFSAVYKREQFSLPDEIIVEILMYIPTEMIIAKCCLVSRQWFSNCWKVPLFLRINTRRVGCNFESLLMSNGLDNCRIQSLDLSFVPLIGNSILHLLSKCPGMEHLQSLNLTRCRIRSDGMKTLSESTIIQSLSSLILSGNEIGLEGVKILCHPQSLIFSKLKVLDLCDCALTPECFYHLSSTSNLINLLSLNLRNCLVGNEGSQQLSQSPFIKQLTLLDLTFSQVSFEGIKSLSHSPNMLNLKKLDLSHCEITDEGVRELSSSPHLSNLTNLNLTFCKLGPEIAEFISTSRNLPNLSTLNVSFCRIGWEGMKKLSRVIPHLVCSSLGSIKSTALEEDFGYQNVAALSSSIVAVSN